MYQSSPRPACNLEESSMTPFIVVTYGFFHAYIGPTSSLGRRKAFFQQPVQQLLAPYSPSSLTALHLYQHSILTMLKTLKLRGGALAAVLCMTDACLGIDPRLVKSSLASTSLLLNRESGGDCPNVQPLEGSKDATVRKVVVLLRPLL